MPSTCCWSKVISEIVVGFLFVYCNWNQQNCQRLHVSFSRTLMSEKKSPGNNCPTLATRQQRGSLEVLWNAVLHPTLGLTPNCLLELNEDCKWRDALNSFVRTVESSVRNREAIASLLLLTRPVWFHLSCLGSPRLFWTPVRLHKPDPELFPRASHKPCSSITVISIMARTSRCGHGPW